MKKKKIIISLFVLFLVLIGIYLYVYKEHRNIAAEKGSFAVTATDIFSEFQTNESVANAKYLDKTIEVSGKISSIDFETQSMVINEKLFASFSDEIPKNIQPDSEIKIKGRFIGYDSLLEELKLDQCIIVN